MLSPFKKSLHRTLLEELIHRHRRSIRGNILDVGSKNRRYDALFEGSITAVDLIPSIEFGVQQEDLDKGLSFHNETFDSVLCIEVLCYVKNPEHAISELLRVLKQGGCALFTVASMFPDIDDRMHISKGFVNELLPEGITYEALPYGNKYVVIWDILRDRVIHLKNPIVKRVCMLLLTPIYLIIGCLRLDRVADRYYSGVFVICKKEP